MTLKTASDWARIKLFEIVTLTLAIVAIVFAWIQYHDAGTQLNRLEMITSSIQTQYVGEFPVNLDKIIDVVNAGTENGELDIMTDFPGYAIYSRNDRFRAYYNALVSAHQQRNIQIKMMVYDKELAEKAFRIQFKPSDFDEEKQKGFRDFFKKYPPEPKNYEEFVARIIDFQAHSADNLCREGVELRRVPAAQKYLFFLWQTNNPEAVFAFRNEAEKNREISFHSLDPKLIEIFKTIFSQTWSSADPKAHPELAAGEDPGCKFLPSAGGPP
jgi:hypothetical protein